MFLGTILTLQLFTFTEAKWLVVAMRIWGRDQVPNGRPKSDNCM